MIKVAYLALGETNFVRRYSPNNDGVFGNVQFVDVAGVDLKSAHHDVDYIIACYQYALADFSVCVDPERLWLTVGEPYEFPLQECFENRNEFAKVVSYAGARVAHGDIMPVCTPSWMDKISVPELLKMSYPKKTKNLSWITSKKVYFKGHMQRLKLVHALHGENICDMFGNGFQYVENKIDTLSPYKYSIAMENTATPEYITEKAMDCWLAYAMPLYMGSSDMGKYFPEKSFVALDINDKHLIEKITDISTTDLYKERRPYVEEARHIVMHEMNMFVQLAEKIERHHTSTPKGKKQPINVRGVQTSRNIPKKALFKIYQTYYNWLLRDL